MILLGRHRIKEPLMTIQKLLNRIRQDKEFAKGEFVIGYYDSVGEHVIRCRFMTFTLTRIATSPFR